MLGLISKLNATLIFFFLTVVTKRKIDRIFVLTFFSQNLMQDHRIMELNRKKKSQFSLVNWWTRESVGKETLMLSACLPVTSRAIWWITLHDLLSYFSSQPYILPVYCFITVLNRPIRGPDIKHGGHIWKWERQAFIGWNFHNVEFSLKRIIISLSLWLPWLHQKHFIIGKEYFWNINLEENC